MIDTGTWDDPWFADLEPDAKLLFLYLLTNRRSTAAGAFEITVRAMAFETGLAGKRIEALLPTFGDRVQWWSQHQVIWVRNFFKRQAANEKFTISAQRVVADLPVDVQCVVATAYPNLVSEGISAQCDTHGNGYATGMDTPSAVIGIDKGSSRDSGVADANAPDNPTGKSKRATQVPDDFTVTDALKAWGAENGYTEAQMLGQVPQFIDHYRGKGEARKDWNRSFHNWMRNAESYGHLTRAAGSLTIVNGDSPFAGRGFDPLRRISPEEQAEHDRLLAKAKAEQDAMIEERRRQQRETERASA
jgi:hypothetical protein